MGILTASDEPIGIRRLAALVVGSTRRTRVPPRGLEIAVAELDAEGKIARVPMRGGMGIIPKEYESHYSKEG